MTTQLFRVFIGPELGAYTDTDIFVWTDVTTGVGSLLYASQDNVLLSELNEYDTVVHVSDTGGQFASKGGVWVKDPTGPCVYVSYTGVGSAGVDESNLTGAYVRSAHPEQPNNMPVGSQVSNWYMLSDNDGVLDINWTTSDTWSFAEWQINLSGVFADSNMMVPMHLIAVEMKEQGSDTWVTQFVGMLKDVRMTDDSTGVAQWSIVVEPTSVAYAVMEIQPYRIGDWHIGSSGTADADSTLGHRLLEISNPDIVDASQTFEPDKAVDGDMGSLWIGAPYIGAEGDPDDKSGISEVYFDVPEGLLSGMRFIQGTDYDFRNTEFWVYDATQTQWYEIVSDEGWLEDRLDGGGNRGTLGLVVQREDDFEQVWPDAIYDELRDCQSRTDTDVVNFLSYFRRAGGIWCFPDNGEAVRWGTMQSTWPAGGPSQPGNVVDLAACPGAGYSMLYNTTDNQWEWSSYVTPGNTDSQGGTAISWLHVTLPPLNRKVKEAVLSGNSTVTVVDGQGVETTGGLPNDGGEVVIDGVIYTVQTKTATTITVSGTFPGDVEVNTPIYSYMRAVDGVGHGIDYTTDSYPIIGTEWERTAGGIHPRNFDLYWSQLIARSPDQSEWENDYYLVQNVLQWSQDEYYTVHVAGTGQNADTGSRIRMCVLRIWAVGTNAAEGIARASMNEFRFTVDPAFFAGDPSQTWTTDPQSIEETMVDIISDGPYGPAAVVVGDYGDDVTDHVTEVGPMGPVLSDLAKFGCSVVYARPDSKMFVGHTGLLTTDYDLVSPGPEHIYVDSELVEVDIAQARPDSVSHVSVSYQLPDGSVGSVEYPVPPSFSGYRREAGPFLVSTVDEATMIATNLYRWNRYPYYIDYQLAEADMSIGPFDLHKIEWTWGEETTTGRKVLVRTVNHRIQGGQMITTCSGHEVGRRTA